MTIKDVYEIVKRIEEKLDQLVCKDDCKEKHSNVWKVMFSLFGLDLLGIVTIIITIWFK